MEAVVLVLINIFSVFLGYMIAICAAKRHTAEILRPRSDEPKMGRKPEPRKEA